MVFTYALNTQKSVSAGGVVARGAEAAKRNVYEKLVDPNSQSFIPMAFHMQGRWDQALSAFLSKVKAIALDKRELLQSSVGRRAISVGFQRGIARSARNIQSQPLAVQDLPRRSYRRRFLDLGRI